jgi:hypothetical protein
MHSRFIPLFVSLLISAAAQAQVSLSSGVHIDQPNVFLA